MIHLSCQPPYLANPGSWPQQLFGLKDKQAWRSTLTYGFMAPGFNELPRPQTRRGINPGDYSESFMESVE